MARTRLRTRGPLATAYTMSGVVALGCAATLDPTDQRPEPRRTDPSVSEPSSTPANLPPADPLGDDEPVEAEPAPELPPGIEPGVRVEVRIPRDRPAHVIHGEPTTRRALVYFHGVCGDVTAIGVWAREVSKHGTVVALLGDQKCEGTSRYKWSQYIPGLHARVERALAVVSEVRGGLLDTDTITAMGYSQGATRAAALVGRYPERYTRVLAAGIPTKPRADRIGKAEVIAVVGGELEPTGHMEAGVDALKSAGRTAEFFSLPGGRHGDYGPEGGRVMDEAFRFLFNR